MSPHSPPTSQWKQLRKQQSLTAERFSRSSSPSSPSSSPPTPSSRPQLNRQKYQSVSCSSQCSPHGTKSSVISQSYLFLCFRETFLSLQAESLPHLPGLCPLPSQAVLLHQQWLRLSQSSGSELCKEFRREHNFKVHFTIVSNEVLKVEIMWIYLEQLLLSCWYSNLPVLSSTISNRHLRLPKHKNKDKQTASSNQNHQETSKENQVDLVLHIYWISDGLHRVGGDDVVLHLRLPRQGGGSEHVLQCGQHHNLLRLAIGIIDVSMS